MRLEQANSETENRTWQRVRWRGKGRQLNMIKKVLGIDSEAGYTALCIYLMPLDCMSTNG
jgi:hypothetical protein